MQISSRMLQLLACLLAATLSTSVVSAAPQKIFAISHQNIEDVAGNPADTIMFYDVSAIDSGGAVDVFNNSPMFSVWLGFEIFEGQELDNPTGTPIGNQEDVSALTFNHANGTIYAAAFDSNLGAPGNPDDVGDSTGDWDLYRIDYQELLADFVDNSRPMGTIYAPRAIDIPLDAETFLRDNGSNLYDGTIDGLANDIPHPEGLTSTVNIDNAIQKVGELARSQAVVTFFDTEIDFINPSSIAVLEAASGENTAGDFQIREWKRVSTSTGAATLDPDGPDNTTGPPGFPGTEDDQQGGRNGNTTESWEATIAGRLELDASGDVESDPAGWALVKHDGTLGVWVADTDGGGDDIAFFELDFTGPTPTATRKELRTSGTGPFPDSIALDENPSVDTTTNDGEVDYLAVDKNGNLIIGESGFFDTIEGSTTPPLGAGGETAEEPRVITVEIADYDSPDSDSSGGNEVTTAGTGFDDTTSYTVSGDIPVLGGVGIDDDDDVTRTDRIAYDKGTGYIYIIDVDDGFTEDIYVFDPATEQIIYSELQAFNPGIFNTGTQVIFTRGDITGDGVVDGADLAELSDAIADPTLGGTVSADVGGEWYDLTGDGILTEADLTELQNIIGTTPGDFDANGAVVGFDFLKWQRDFPTLTASDLTQWEANLGSGVAASPAASAVPEPAAATMGLALAALAMLKRRR